MNNYLYESLAERYAVRLNRGVIEAVYNQNPFLPLTTNWHSLIKNADTGISVNAIPTLNDDVFVGKVEVLNSTWLADMFQPVPLYLPKFMQIDSFGGAVMLYRNFKYEQGKYVIEGVFGYIGMSIAPTHNLLVEYTGYLLKIQ